MIFDQLQKGFGSVPNLYATREYPEHALGNYLALQNGKSSLNGKAREVINLVVSEVNRCQYWLAVRDDRQKDRPHRRTDPRDPQRESELRCEARCAGASCARYGRQPRSRGRCVGRAFFVAGWTKASLVDAIVVIDDKTAKLVDGR
jgi:hypothetical protein